MEGCVGIEGERPDQARPDGVGADSLPQDRRNAADYNNEIAGRDTGRAKRFLPLADEISLREKEREKERAFNALMRVLQDPAYAKLYYEAQDTVTGAEDAARRVLEKLTQERAIASENIENIRGKAAELPDGRKVYRSAKDGRLYAEDGSDVTDHGQSVRGLSDSAPSWEDYSRARDTVDDVDRRTRDVQTYQRDVLDPARQRLDDKDNPPSQDDLRDIIAGTKGSMTPDVRTAYEDAQTSKPAVNATTKNSAATAYVGSADLNAPLLQLDFASAHNAPSAELPAATPTPAATPKAP